MPRRQWPRSGHRRARPRPLRALALAALLSGELRRRLPAVPRLRHGHRARPGPQHAPRSSSAKRAASAATSSRASTIRTSCSSPRASRSPSSKATRTADQLEIPRLNKLGDSATSNDVANNYYAQATNLTVTVSNIDAQVEQLDQQLPRPAAGNQEGRPGPQRSPHEDP